MAEKHTRYGWWLEEAGFPRPRSPLDGDLDADVVVVGGGYTGMWTAWFASEAEPEARVVLLEAEVCGTGPSGRNGGFANAMWFSLGTLRRRFGDDEALRVARAGEAAVDGIGAWCAEHGVDAWYRRGGYLQVSTTPLHDGATRAAAAVASELGVPDACVPQSPDEVRRRCDSPLFRGGAYHPAAATVQPARLAQGLRDRLIRRGVLIFEDSRARRLRSSRGALEVETSAGRVRARLGRARRRWWSRSARSDPPPAHRCVESHGHHRAGAGRAGGDRVDRRGMHHRFASDGPVLPHDARRPDRVRVGRRSRRPRRPRERASRGRPTRGRRGGAAAGPGLSRPARPPDRARLGRPDRRLPDPPAGDRQPRRRPRPLRLRIHGQRRRAIARGRPRAGLDEPGSQG